MNGDDIQKVVDFLKANGWKYDSKDTYMHFYKKDSIAVDVGTDEVVFIDDSGDFAHIPLNFYAVVGFVYVRRLILPVVPDGI